MRESPKHLPWKEEHVQSPAGKVLVGMVLVGGQFEEVAGAGVRPER